MEIPIALLLGGLSAYIASTKGRSVVGWFFVGFFFPCIGLVIILVIGDEGATEDLRHENRRLREKLRMDRAVSDRRHRDTEERLHVHDVALGVNTSERLEEADKGFPEHSVGSGADGDNARFYSVRWHYALADQQHGPISFDELKELWNERVLDPESLVWNRHLSDWKAIDQLRDLEDELGA